MIILIITVLSQISSINKTTKVLTLPETLVYVKSLSVPVTSQPTSFNKVHHSHFINNKRVLSQNLLKFNH